MTLSYLRKQQFLVRLAGVCLSKSLDQAKKQSSTHATLIGFLFNRLTVEVVHIFSLYPHQESYRESILSNCSFYMQTFFYFKASLPVLAWKFPGRSEKVESWVACGNNVHTVTYMLLVVIKSKSTLSVGCNGLCNAEGLTFHPGKGLPQRPPWPIRELTIKVTLMLHRLYLCLCTRESRSGGIVFQGFPVGLSTASLNKI